MGDLREMRGFWKLKEEKEIAFCGDCAFNESMDQLQGRLHNECSLNETQLPPFYELFLLSLGCLFKQCRYFMLTAIVD